MKTKLILLLITIVMLPSMAMAGNIEFDEGFYRDGSGNIRQVDPTDNFVLSGRTTFENTSTVNATITGTLGVAGEVTFLGYSGPLWADGSGNVFPGSAGSEVKFKQFVFRHYTAYVAVTTTIPFDNTKPEIDEGTEFMRLQITPKDAGSVLKLHARLNASPDTSDSPVTIALFDNATSIALATGTQQWPSGKRIRPIDVFWNMSSLSKDTRDLRVRAGPYNSQLFKVNGGYGAGGTDFLDNSLDTFFEIFEVMP